MSNTISVGKSSWQSRVLAEEKKGEEVIISSENGTEARSAQAGKGEEYHVL